MTFSFSSWLKAAVLAAGMAVSSGQSWAQHQVDDTWTLVVGSDPLEQTAAEDLKVILARDQKLTLQGPVLADQFKGDGPAIVIGTVDDNALVARAAAGKAFVLNPQEPESYNAAFRNGRLYIVGESAKGAMNGVYRFVDRGQFALENYDVHESPAFRVRVGGHKMNQTPPPDWTEEQQARYYARHYINVVWGEKKGPPMSYESRRKYGLGVMAEVRFPPKEESWRNDPDHASCVYQLSDKKTWKVIDPFDPAGRQAYKEGFEQLLKETPDLRVLYGVFGDYNAIPDEKSFRLSDRKPYGHTREDGIIEIMGIMKEVCQGKDILLAAWMWHSFFGRDAEAADYMKKLADMGFGSVYNEAGNSDCWIIRRDNYNPMAIKTGADGKTHYGLNYLPLVSAGGACESLNPVIGFPLPNVAEIKIKRLADLGIRNFCIWWAGYEGWIYEPNNEVVSELIWHPEAYREADSTAKSFDPKNGDAIMRKIAVRDFGNDLAPDIMKFWQLVDDALVSTAPLYEKPDQLPPPDKDGLHIHDWYQRMGIFTEAVFGGAYPVPLTPKDIAGRIEYTDPKNKSWMKDTAAMENYAIVLQRLGDAVKYLDSLKLKAMSPEAALRIGDMDRWTNLYRLLLTSQYNFARAVTVMHTHRDLAMDTSILRKLMTPIALAEIGNDRALIALITYRDEKFGGFAPNFNIRQNMEGTVKGMGSITDEVAVQRAKIGAMQLWLDDMPNIAKGCKATASSVEKAEYDPANAVDGDPATRWGSQYSDSQWLAIDLGKVTPVQIVQITWKNAYAASYDVQVSADAAPESWQTVYHTDTGRGNTETIVLDTATPARFVRMNATKRGSPWGYAITELSVYAAKK